MIEMNSNSGHLSLSGFRLISLKVLNSIVLLGKSCQYVKEAKMEEKLFNPPPTSTPSKPPSKSQSKCKPSQGKLGSSHRCSASFSGGLFARALPGKKSLLCQRLAELSRFEFIVRSCYC